MSRGKAGFTKVADYEVGDKLVYTQDNYEKPTYRVPILMVQFTHPNATHYYISEIDSEFNLPDPGVLFVPKGARMFESLYGRGGAYLILNMHVWKGQEDVWTW